jgi:hypothetical protein
MIDQEFYYPDMPWYIIKSFLLTFNKTRITKTASIIKPFCEDFNEMLSEDFILPDTTFSFVYFHTRMKYRKNFNYRIFQI